MTERFKKYGGILRCLVTQDNGALSYYDRQVSQAITTAAQNPYNYQSMKQGNNILSMNPVLGNKILTWEVNEQFAPTKPRLLSADVEDRFFCEAASANRKAAIRLFHFLQGLPGGAVEAGRLYQYIAQFLAGGKERGARRGTGPGPSGNTVSRRRWTKLTRVR